MKKIDELDRSLHNESMWDNLVENIDKLEEIMKECELIQRDGKTYLKCRICNTETDMKFAIENYYCYKCSKFLKGEQK